MSTRAELSASGRAVVGMILLAENLVLLFKPRKWKIIGGETVEEN